MLNYCHIPVLGKSLMEDTKIAKKQQDLDIDVEDNEMEEIRKSYSNWRQGGAVGTLTLTPKLKTTSQVMMPTTAIYLRYVFLCCHIHVLISFCSFFLFQSTEKTRNKKPHELFRS